MKLNIKKYETFYSMAGSGVQTSRRPYRPVTSNF